MPSNAGGVDRTPSAGADDADMVPTPHQEHDKVKSIEQA